MTKNENDEPLASNSAVEQALEEVLAASQAAADPEPSPQFCKCGRPAGHRGAHRGAKLRKTEAEPEGHEQESAREADPDPATADAGRAPEKLSEVAEAWLDMIAQFRLGDQVIIRTRRTITEIGNSARSSEGWRNDGWEVQARLEAIGTPAVLCRMPGLPSYGFLTALEDPKVVAIFSFATEGMEFRTLIMCMLVDRTGVGSYDWRDAYDDEVEIRNVTARQGAPV
jgi:hypothetical protein